MEGELCWDNLFASLRGLTEKCHDTLRACLFLTVPDMFSRLMESILYKAITVWGQSRAKRNRNRTGEGEDEEGDGSGMDAENAIGELRTVVILKLVFCV